jgi:DNA helicase-2/ATP-dependent DNA helicase PcrA
MDFDESQRAVLALTTGRQAVFAPPGSGKTALLVHRVRAAVDRGVDPARMACLTFTNRAARVMVERMPPTCARVFVGNFHAFGLRLLGREGVFPIGGTVLDEEDSHLFLVDAVEESLAALAPARREGISRMGIGALSGLTRLRAALDLRRELRLDREVVEEAAVQLPAAAGAGRETERFLREAAGRYRALKRRSLAIDFEDILALTAEHLAHRRRLGEPGPMDWVQVDEAQDLNAIQWSILRDLLHDGSHLLILGDLQQSIFSFMGSSLARLERETAGFPRLGLRTNYRSPAYLLDFFGDYCRQVLRMPVRIEAADRRRDAAEALVRRTFSTDRDERREIVRTFIPELEEQGARSIAVLTRTNRTAFEVSKELKLAGREHFLVSHFDLLRTANAKDFLALLSVLWRPSNRVAWMRLLRLFGGARSLGEARETVNDLFEAAASPGELLEDGRGAREWPLERLADRVRGGTVVVFDVETTGLDVREDDIVQIAAVELRKGRPGRTFHALLRTERPLRGSAAIHGLTAARLEREGLGREEALGRFLEFIGAAPLAAHNLEFDWRMLNANLRREGFPPLPPSRERFCTLRAARALHPGAPRHTLAALLPFLKIDGRNTHDARDDALAAALLLARLARDARGRRRRARAALDRHQRAIERLRAGMRPLLSRLETLGEGEVGFAGLFDLFFAHVKDRVRGYAWDFEKDLRHKLLRHMTATCPRAPLGDLLGRHLPRYLGSREPDLILDGDRLVVSTVHRAKGLEFDAVIVPEVVDGVYPSSHAVKSGDPAQIAEEARILYVAMTRARRRLIVTGHELALGEGGSRPGARRPTRFLAGLDGHFSG